MSKANCGVFSLLIFLSYCTLSEAQGLAIFPGRLGIIGKQLRVTAHIPRGASGSYWAAVSVTSGQMPRISIPVVVTVQGTEQPDVAFSAPEVVQSANGLLECQSIVENKGNTAVLIRGAFSLEKQVSSKDTEELQIAEVGPVTSLPGTKMKIKANLNWAESMDGLQVNSYMRYGPAGK
jgi:hypothetical protein